MIGAVRVSSQSCRDSTPDRIRIHFRQRRDAITSVTDPVDRLEVVDVVIGVGTHVGTHAAAAIDARAGAVIDQISVEATAQGYDELLEFAHHHAVLRMFAIEVTKSHGAVLARLLAKHREAVVELGRPSAPGDATARSPIPSTRSAPPARRCHDPSSAPPARAASVNAFRCCSLRLAPP